MYIRLVGAFSRYCRTAVLMILLVALVIGFHGDTISQNLTENYVMHLISEYHGDCPVSPDTRTMIFNEIQGLLHKQSLEIDPFIADAVRLEQREFEHLSTVIQQDDGLSQYTLGCQVVINPDFSLLAGWSMYNSEWIHTHYLRGNDNSPDVLGEDITRNVLVYDRTGPGHGSLTQTLYLENHRCYVFTTLGAVDRRDETPTIWLYWETYEGSTPSGQGLVRMNGTQVWNRYIGTFCLDDPDTDLVKVTIAPVNLYGNAKAYVSSTRVYELR